MKKTPFYLLTLFVALVFAANFSAIAFAQAPPEIIDPFATTGDDDDAAADEAPPALVLPAAEEPAAPAAEEPPAPAAEEPAAPAAEEPPAAAEEEAPPTLEMAPASTTTTTTTTHAAAAAPASYSGGKVADSGPGLIAIGLGSLFGAAAIRRRKK